MNAGRNRITADQRGFTLIEVLVTIIISAVLAVVLAQVIANQTDRSYRPIRVINENLALRAVMENIAADFRAGTSTQVVASRLTSYWDSSFTGNIPIDVNATCVTFDPTTRSEQTVADGTCPLLKISLTVQGSPHGLTSLFAP